MPQSPQVLVWLGLLSCLVLVVETAATKASTALTVTAFSVTSCPTALPSAIARSSITISGTGTQSANATPTAVPVIAAQYVSTESSQTQLELDYSNVRYQFDTTHPGLLKFITSNFDSLSLSSNGSFEYIAPNCSYGIRGTLSKPATTNTHKPRTKRAGQILERVLPGTFVTVNIAVENQCTQAGSGAPPHLLCHKHSMGDATVADPYSRPIVDFHQIGLGQFSGVCSYPHIYHQMCELGADACTDEGINGLEQLLPCSSFSAIGTAFINFETGGLSLPTNGFIAGLLLKLCGFALSEALTKFCEWSHPTGSSCAPAEVTPIVSLKYVSVTTGLGFDSTTYMAVATSKQIQTMSTTVTSLAPECTIAQPAIPNPGPYNCPKGMITSVWKYCASCYKATGIDELLDIYCDTCCGCCITTSPDGEPAGSAVDTCCSGAASDPPGCFTDNPYTCAQFFTYGATCSIASTQQLCDWNDAWLSGSNPKDGLLLSYQICADPNLYLLFNPTRPDKRTQCLVQDGQVVGWGLGGP